ncbi:MAG: hypothetical protein ACHQD9_05100 [Chitinophagales bacterium]
MLFLAVSAGFFVENLRENLSDHTKEREYVKSMVEDLKTDSAFLDLSINKLIPYHIAWMDSTVHLFQMPEVKGKDRLIYQAFMIGTAWTYNFHPTERTLSQLHTEGYHLIRDKTAANAISELEDRYHLYLQTTAFVENLQNEIDLSAYSFASRTITDQITVVAFQKFQDSLIVNLKLSDVPETAAINFENKDAIKEYTDKIGKYSFFIQYAIKNEYIIMLREVNKTKDILNKEYHPE